MIPCKTDANADTDVDTFTDKDAGTETDTDKDTGKDNCTGTDKYTSTGSGSDKPSEIFKGLVSCEVEASQDTVSSQVNDPTQHSQTLDTEYSTH